MQPAAPLQNRTGLGNWRSEARCLRFQPCQAACEARASASTCAKQQLPWTRTTLLATLALIEIDVLHQMPSAQGSADGADAEGLLRLGQLRTRLAGEQFA